MSNYADSSRVDGKTIKGYKYDVYLSMKHNQENIFVIVCWNKVNIKTV